jgi:hypothetical protein
MSGHVRWGGKHKPLKPGKWAVLWIGIVLTFDPDSTFYFDAETDPDPDPQQRIKVFLPNKLFLSSRKYDPGC